MLLWGSPWSCYAPCASRAIEAHGAWLGLRACALTPWRATTRSRRRSAFLSLTILLSRHPRLPTSRFSRRRRVVQFQNKLAGICGEMCNPTPTGLQASACICKEPAPRSGPEGSGSAGDGSGERDAKVALVRYFLSNGCASVRSREPA